MSTLPVRARLSPLEEAALAETVHRGLWGDALRRLVRNRLALVGMVALILITLMAFVGPDVGIFGRHDPIVLTRGAERQSGPTWEHWFGTDQLGRDNWARVLAGIRVSLQIGIGTQLVVLAIGVTMGVLAALGGKLSDTIVMRATDITFAFPDLLFIILIRSVLLGRDWPIIGDQKVLLIISIALVNWTIIARLVRGQMLSLNERDFVIAARALGAPRWRIVVAHMLPNTLGPVIVAVMFGIPIAIFAEAALGFIGLGLDLSLGSLVFSGYNTIQRNVWNVVFPAAAIAILMLCFTFIGDGLRDALDPRTR